jgi:chitin synthase
MKPYYKGPLVYESKTLRAYAADTGIAKCVLARFSSFLFLDGMLMKHHRIWGIYQGKIYDLTDYLNTITMNPTNDAYKFLDNDIVSVFKQQSGQDITKPLNAVLDGMATDQRGLNLECLNNVFYAGDRDFRKDARCTVQNYFLIVASGIMMASIGLKCAFRLSTVSA